ncbi:MAG: hypothetical protein LBS51_07405 [Oscillospiraceae bacterium]|jgi:hypothetical protein|nr:hypothetical protein [Oscillospiraceae bacterium]
MVTDLLRKRQMYLKFIERNTAMKVRVKTGGEDSGAEYTVSFYDLDTEMAFWAKSEALHNLVSASDTAPRVEVTFWLRENMYTFEGRAMGPAPHIDDCAVLIEQLSPILAISRRSDARNEMRIPVNLYDIAPEDMALERPRAPERAPVFTAETFDISAGGFCLVSNEPLVSSGPLFLAEFSLSDKNDFLLPVRLLRKGDCPQTVLYHYDYGFLFIFDKLRDEKARIASAITNTVFKTRLASVTR